jgi:hypothetical protein
MGPSLTIASPVHGGGVTRRRAGGERGDRLRDAQSRPFHHALYGARSPSPASRGRQ